MYLSTIVTKNHRLWLEYLAKFRHGLPMECTLLVSENELEDSVNQGFEHIKGTLLYANLLDESESDSEQAWTDLVLRLDDASYYAIMAMPLVRQYLMSNPQEIVDSLESQIRTKPCDKELPSSFLAFKGQRASYAKLAWELAEKFKALRENFATTSELGEFLCWCISFLELSGKLVSLAAQVCSKRWSQTPHENK